MEETTHKKSIDSKQISAAIVVMGILIAGAILLKDSKPPVKQASNEGSISAQIGLDTKKFNACLANGKYKSKVQADVEDGNKAGVQGTPSSFIIVNDEVDPWGINVVSNEVVDTIAGGQPFENVMQQIKDAPNKKATNIKIRPISAEDHILGSVSAKIIIVEYSDLECPFCKVFHETMHQVVDRSGGDVAWVYRHYPIPQLHSKATLEAEATECAWEQGGNDAFWEYADKLFEITPSNNGLLEAQL